MINVYDEHIKKRIEINKRKNDKEVKAIFERSISDLYNVQEQYMDASRQIILHTAAKLDGKIRYDNFYCEINTHLKDPVGSHFLFECVEKYRKEKDEVYIVRQNVERAL